MPTLTKKVSRITSKKLSSRMNGKAATKLKTKKRVYFFGNGKAEGTTAMKELLGGRSIAVSRSRRQAKAPSQNMLSTALLSLYSAKLNSDDGD